jgi:hypothetical protein
LSYHEILTRGFTIVKKKEKREKKGTNRDKKRSEETYKNKENTTEGLNNA